MTAKATNKMETASQIREKIATERATHKKKLRSLKIKLAVRRIYCPTTKEEAEAEAKADEDAESNDPLTTVVDHVARDPEADAKPSTSAPVATSRDYTDSIMTLNAQLIMLTGFQESIQPLLTDLESIMEKASDEIAPCKQEIKVCDKHNQRYRGRLPGEGLEHFELMAGIQGHSSQVFQDDLKEVQDAVEMIGRKIEGYGKGVDGVIGEIEKYLEES